MKIEAYIWKDTEYNRKIDVMPCDSIADAKKWLDEHTSFNKILAVGEAEIERARWYLWNHH